MTRNKILSSAIATVLTLGGGFSIAANAAILDDVIRVSEPDSFQKSTVHHGDGQNALSRVVSPDGASTGFNFDGVNYTCGNAKNAAESYFARGIGKAEVRQVGLTGDAFKGWNVSFPNAGYLMHAFVHNLFFGCNGGELLVVDIKPSAKSAYFTGFGPERVAFGGLDADCRTGSGGKIDNVKDSAGNIFGHSIVIAKKPLYLRNMLVSKGEYRGRFEYLDGSGIVSMSSDGDNKYHLIQLVLDTLPSATAGVFYQVVAALPDDGIKFSCQQ